MDLYRGSLTQAFTIMIIPRFRLEFGPLEMRDNEIFRPETEHMEIAILTECSKAEFPATVPKQGWKLAVGICLLK